MGELNYHQECSLLEPRHLAHWGGLPLCWVNASPVAFTRHLRGELPVLAMIDSGIAQADFEFERRQVHLDVTAGTMGLFEPGASRSSRWRCIAVRRILLQVDLPWLVGRGLADDEWDTLRVRQDVAFRDEALATLMRAMVREAAAGSPHGPGYAESLSVDLLLRLVCTHGVGVRQLRERGRLTAAQLRRVESLIDARLEGPIPLGALADSAGLSAPHFVRLFRRAVGCSPHQHVLRRRVERAQRMIERTSLHLSDIAAAVGFATQSHMNATFMRQLGISPGRYRVECGMRRPTAPSRRDEGPA